MFLDINDVYVPECLCYMFLNLKEIYKILNVPELSWTSIKLPVFVMQMFLKIENVLNVPDCS